MAMQQLNLRISENEASHLEMLASQTDGILSKPSVVRLLIQQAIEAGWTPLDRPTKTLIMEDQAARRASTNTFNTFSNSSKSLNQQINKCLESHGDLIREFWRIKKGSRGQTAWKLLMAQLCKMQERHGDAVVKDQLEMAINGKWAGISVARYEQFKAPKGGRLAEAADATKHPASRLFMNGQWVDDQSPVTNSVLRGAF